jgi:hypothetical protein
MRTDCDKAAIPYECDYIDYFIATDADLAA